MINLNIPTKCPKCDIDLDDMSFDDQMHLVCSDTCFTLREWKDKGLFIWALHSNGKYEIYLVLGKSNNTTAISEYFTKFIKQKIANFNFIPDINISSQQSIDDTISLLLTFQ